MEVTKSDLIHNHPCTKTNYDAKKHWDRPKWPGVDTHIEQCYCSTFPNQTSVETTNGEDSVSDTEEVYDELDGILNLSEREKFKHVMPILLKIGNLVSKHSTEDFYGYLEDLEELEKAIRRRQRYRSNRLSSENHTEITEDSPNNEDPPLESVDPTSSVDASSSLSATPELVPKIVANDTSPPVDVSSCTSKFHDIAFKEALKKKGRPKNTTKQVSFRKTVHDQPKKVKKGKTNGKSTVPNNAFKELVREFRDDPMPMEIQNIDYGSQLLPVNLPNVQHGFFDSAPTQVDYSVSQTVVPFVNHLPEGNYYTMWLLTVSKNAFCCILFYFDFLKGYL